MTPYKEFHINPQFQIFKKGKRVFVANWQHCFSLEDAKKLIDVSLEAAERLKKLPDLNRIKQLNTEPREIENGSQKAEQFEAWMNNEAEKQLNPPYYE